MGNLLYAEQNNETPGSPHLLNRLRNHLGQGQNLKENHEGNKTFGKLIQRQVQTSLYLFGIHAGQKNCDNAFVALMGMHEYHDLMWLVFESKRVFLYF